MEENINTDTMSLKEQVDFLMKQKASATPAPKPPRVKKVRIPRKAKVRRGKAKQGWVGVITIDEQGIITGEKQKLEDSVIRLKEKTYHVNDGTQVGLWEGKFPVTIQQKWNRQPLKIRQGDEENKTFGDKYIMAKMLGDTIKIKAAAGAKGLLYIVGILVVAYIGYMAFTGQL